MLLRKNRKTETSATNAARTLFESSGFVFQEVDLANDYGKDAYIDTTKEGGLTGLCIGVQIKGGKSCRRPCGYGIRIDKSHERVWRNSSVPIGGIVFDPEDGKLYWCNISKYLLDRSTKNVGSYIPVPRENVLTETTLRTEFAESFELFGKQSLIGQSLLKMFSQSRRDQMGALVDCFALGRSDYRLFVALRHVMFSFNGVTFQTAIHLLAHTTPHPDIVWDTHNWIPDEVCKKVVPHFRWTVDELIRLVGAASWSEWTRTGVGESIYMLVKEDPDFVTKMERAAVRALHSRQRKAAFIAMYLTIYETDDSNRKYEQFLSRDSRFGDFSISPEIEECLAEHGGLPLF